MKKLRSKAGRFLETARVYLRNNPDRRIKTVYFLAWKTREHDAPVAVVNNINDIELID